MELTETILVMKLPISRWLFDMSNERQTRRGGHASAAQTKWYDQAQSANWGRSDSLVFEVLLSRPPSLPIGDGWNKNRSIRFGGIPGLKIETWGTQLCFS